MQSIKCVLNVTCKSYVQIIHECNNYNINTLKILTYFLGSGN